MRKALRENEMTFGRVMAARAWGHKARAKTVLLDLEPGQAAVLATLCQAAVQEHYKYDRRRRAAKTSPVQLLIGYGDKPAVVVKRPRKKM